MQHAPLSAASPLLPELAAELARVRAARGFDPATYLAAKMDLLLGYLTTHNLRGAVLGMSGGIDSAVVLGILRAAQARAPEVLKGIVPLCLPTHRAAIGQRGAMERAIYQCNQWGVEPKVCNLNSTHEIMAYEMEWTVSGAEASDWARGQLTSYIRTPALYFATSLLADQGIPAVVVGTTNRDEGAYLGYVGKASDGMVDLQLIADLHKSEVRALAKHLGVTQAILDAVPSGEMHDGRVDEEVFGAPYDFVELYLALKCEALPHPLVKPLGDWSVEALRQYHDLSANLEALHRYNAHKYLVGSPAVHLNVLESAVPGGWVK